MPTELFSEYYRWTVTSGGTDAPANGTSQSFTVGSATGAPAAATGVSQFRIVDAADTNTPPEIMTTTNVAGTTWTVTRGAESGATWAHAANWTAIPVLTAQGLASSQFFYGGERAPFDQPALSLGVNYGGFPGRRLIWGQGGFSTPLGWAVNFPFVVSQGELAHVARYKMNVDGPQAGALLDCAVYSVPSLVDAATGTKMSATERTNIDCSTSGGKNVALPGSVLLPPGAYQFVWLVHGSATTPTFYALNIVESAWQGSDVTQGNGAASAGVWGVTLGVTSLAATYSFSGNNLGGIANAVPITMHNA